MFVPPVRSKEFALDIGQKIKMIRKARGLSQRELASRAGLTNGTISLIEKNKSSPSVASLKRLLDAVPISLSEFFSDFEVEDRAKIFFRADEFTEIAPQGHANGSAVLSLRQVGDASQHTLQFLHENYPPGGDTGPELLSHPGEEAGIVISGEIEITVADQVCVLKAGDGYLFDSRLPHRFRNIGKTHCEIMSASTPPTF
jgi:transcriptional regulator with XRE-family HTH domain